MKKINKINVCCQKVLPLVYDESLSYYEVLCKVIQKLNELIKINNNIRDEVHKEYVEILETAKQVTEAVATTTKRLARGVCYSSEIERRGQWKKMQGWLSEKTPNRKISQYR